MDIDLKSFRESAISPSRLRSFVYCEAQPIVNQLSPRPGNTEAAKAGSIRHQIDLSWQVDRLGELEPVEVYTVEEALGFLRDTLRGALRRRIVLANTFDVRTFASIVPELVPGRGLLGYPDAVDCRGPTPVIIEEKLTTPPPTGVWPGHKVQVLGYLAGLEALGYHCPRARVVYRGRTSEAEYTSENARWLRRVARRLDEVEKGATPRPSYRCEGCLWSESCPWAERRVARLRGLASYAEQPSIKSG